MKKINKKLNKAIKKLNPGIKVLNGQNICPLRSDLNKNLECIKDCVAYRCGHDINVVNPNVADNYFKTNTDWINELINQGWNLKETFIQSSSFQPDQTTYLFAKENNLGRCIAFKED